MFFGSGKLYGGTAKSRKTSTYAIPTVARIQSFMRLNARLKAFIYNGASKTLICEQLSPINYDLLFYHFINKNGSLKIKKYVKPVKIYKFVDFRHFRC